jgi:hypothetical protein
MNRLQQLAARKCANYDSSGKCLLNTSPGDNTCVHWCEGLRCQYFERGVLPEKSKLEREYWQARGVVYENATFCERCKNPFERASNRQKYCADCAAEVRRTKKVGYNADYRLKKDI